MALLFSNKISKSFANKVIEVSNKLGIPPNWLMLVMWLESKLNSSIVNGIGCTGLIQFCADKGTPGYKIIGGEKVSLSYLKSLSPEQQLDYVYKYYKPYRSKLTSFEALFLATLTPGYLNNINDDNFKFPDSYYEQNQLYFKYGNSMGSYKRTLVDLVKENAQGFEDSFFEESDGTTKFKTRSVLKIYQKEIIISVVVIGLLVGLWFVGKKLFIKK
jgi:hypothetical protein